jgi:hypothetical protein
MPGRVPFDDLRDYLDRWAKVRMSCEPADRAAAEDGIRQTYAAAGLAPPDHIVWCGGPMEIARRLAAAVSAGDLVGANVKADVFDRVRDKVATLAEIFWKEVVIAALEFSHSGTIRTAVSEHNRCKEVSTAVNRAVLKGVDGYLSRFSVRARHLASRLRGLPRMLPRASFEEVAIGPDQLASLGVYEYLHDVLPWRDLTRPMQGIWKIARNAGWVVPHERVCWVSERPKLLRTDTAARLHCPDGPALQYPDGWSFHAWKGVEVPAWVIEHPESITPDTISDQIDPVLRNCMIEIMTPECFVRSGGATRVSEDDAGVLWRTRWSHRGVTIGAWAAVEVANGTADADGSRRRYFLRVPSRLSTAREAVAWTYGLSPERYAELEVRT